MNNKVDCQKIIMNCNSKLKAFEGKELTQRDTEQIVKLNRVKLLAENDFKIKPSPIDVLNTIKQRIEKIPYTIIKQQNMAINNVYDLRDMLFDQLSRLNKNMSPDELKQEIERTKAISLMATNITNLGNAEMKFLQMNNKNKSEFFSRKQIESSTSE